MRSMTGLFSPHISGARDALLVSGMPDTAHLRCSSCTSNCTGEESPSPFLDLSPATKTSNHFEIFVAGDSKKHYPLRRHREPTLVSHDAFCFRFYDRCESCAGVRKSGRFPSCPCPPDRATQAIRGSEATAAEAVRHARTAQPIRRPFPRHAFAGESARSHAQP